MALTDDGPAEEAGLQEAEETVDVDGLELAIGGDIIIAIDDQPVTGMGDLIAYLVKETHPGDEVTLTILRDGEEEAGSIELGERPGSAKVAQLDIEESDETEVAPETTTETQQLPYTEDMKVLFEAITLVQVMWLLSLIPTVR